MFGFVFLSVYILSHHHINVKNFFPKNLDVIRLNIEKEDACATVRGRLVPFLYLDYNTLSDLLSIIFTWQHTKSCNTHHLRGHNSADRTPDLPCEVHQAD